MQFKSTKNQIKDFVAINLGNCFIKGLIVKNNQIPDYFIEKRKDLSETLKKIWQERKISINKVKISIKNPSCLIRIFPFIKLEKKELKEALFYDLSKHIPFSVQDIYFDFFILNDISANEMNLLVAVAKKDLIDQILEIFEKQNLKVLEISLDSICLINLFLDNYKDNKNLNISILDVGYSSSTLIILEKGIPFIVRELSFSVKELISILANMRCVSVEDIENWLLSLKDYKEFFDISNDILINLYKELRTSFDYFELKRASTIDKMYITGGISNILQASNFFNDLLKVEIKILNKVSQASFLFKDNKFNLFKNAFSVACGLIL